MRQIPRKLRCGETPSLRTGKNKKSIISLWPRNRNRVQMMAFERFSCNIYKRTGKKEKERYFICDHPVTHSNLGFCSTAVAATYVKCYSNIAIAVFRWKDLCTIQYLQSSSLAEKLHTSYMHSWMLVGRGKPSSWSSLPKFLY